MNRIQRLTQHQQTEIDPCIADLRKAFEAMIPAGTKVVIVGNGALAALLIRDEEVAAADGYGSGGSDGGSSSEVSRPTERAALQNTDPDLGPTIDFVHRLVENAKRNMRDAAEQARHLVGHLEFATDLTTKHLGRQADRHNGSGYCRACKRPCSGALNDRLRGGYCDACRKRWERQDRPDRAYFERQTAAWDAPPEAETGT